MYKLLCSIIAFSCLLISCQSSNVTRLMIYSPHGEDLLKAFKQKFEAAHPGVQIDYLDLGSQEIYDRVKLEQTNPQADIWWGASATTFTRAAAEDLLAPYQPSWANLIPTENRDSQHRWYGIYQTPEVIVYNRDAVKAEEAPKDWDEVLDPKWRGKVLIRDPIFSDTMRTIFGAMILNNWQNGPDPGYEWLRKLDANTKEYTANGTLLVQKLARQEGLISLWDLPDVALAINQHQMPLAFEIPRSGTPVVIDGIAIVKGSRNLEWARKFYEFVTTEEHLLLAAKDFYHPPLRTDIARDKLPQWLRAIEIKVMPIDQARFNSELQTWMQYWNNQIKNQNH